MKIKKLYAEPSMRLHELRTSTLLQEASGNNGREGYDPNNPLPFDPDEPIDAD